MVVATKHLDRLKPKQKYIKTNSTRWWFQISYFGEDSHFDSYFSSGLKPPTRVLSVKKGVLKVFSFCKEYFDIKKKCT